MGADTGRNFSVRTSACIFRGKVISASYNRSCHGAFVPVTKLGSLLFPSLMPAADRLTMNAQSSGDLSLMDAPIKKPDSFEPPPFQFIKIAFNAFWISHVGILTQEAKYVTILCGYQ